MNEYVLYFIAFIKTVRKTLTALYFSVIDDTTVRFRASGGFQKRANLFHKPDTNKTCSFTASWKYQSVNTAIALFNKFILK